MTIPDWLSRHDGALRTGPNSQTWLVTFNGHPLYRLFATTAKGQFTCAVTQANNGQRVDQGKQYASIDAALSGGLDELREKLGW